MKPSTTARRPPTRHPLAFLLVTFATSCSVIGASADPALPNLQTCLPQGQVGDASCTYSSLQAFNPPLLAHLKDLVTLPIFRYHKIDLRRECPFWEDDGMCGNRACAVSELDEEEIPVHLRPSTLSALTPPLDERDIPITLDDGCVVRASDFCVRDDESAANSQHNYVDLLANPERFTGYSGPSTARVWGAIYKENCFGLSPSSSLVSTTSRLVSSPLSGGLGGGLSGARGAGITQVQQGLVGVTHAKEELERLMGPALHSDRTAEEETCLEKRVYYRLLSGLHTSISLHLCAEHLDPETEEWGPSLPCFLSRVAGHPERLENLYFTYAALIRALSKLGPSLIAASPSPSDNGPVPVELCTGDEKVDGAARMALVDLVDTTRALTSPGSASDKAFDEKTLFASPEAGVLKEEFKRKFRNVSRIMDCVGCERCRLWGKVQVTGLATGLKLLFEYEEAGPETPPPALTRAELVSFINTMHRFSESISFVDTFRALWAAQDGANAPTTSTAIAPPPLAAKAAVGAQAPKQPADPAQRLAPSPRAARRPPGSAEPQEPGRRGAMSASALWRACRSSWLACFDRLERGLSRWGWLGYHQGKRAGQEHTEL